MITSTHANIYAEDAEAARAFLRDVLELTVGFYQPKHATACGL